jgi:hypothetical protein
MQRQQRTGIKDDSAAGAFSRFPRRIRWRSRLIEFRFPRRVIVAQLAVMNL